MDEQAGILDWLRSLLWAAAVMAAIRALAIPTNIAIGRVIHWDIVAMLSPIGLVALTVLHRRG